MSLTLNARIIDPQSNSDGMVPMMQQSSSDVPVAERIDWWRELTARDLVSTRFTIDRAANFQASATQLELGRLNASVLEFSALRSVRTRRRSRVLTRNGGSWRWCSEDPCGSSRAATGPVWRPATW